MKLHPIFVFFAFAVGGLLGIFCHAYVIDADLRESRANVERLEFDMWQGLSDARTDNERLREELGFATTDKGVFQDMYKETVTLYDDIQEELDARNDWMQGLEEIIFLREAELAKQADLIRNYEGETIALRNQLALYGGTIHNYEKTIERAIADLTEHLAIVPCARIDAILNYLIDTLYLGDC